MKLALITLSPEGAAIAKQLADHFTHADMFVHEGVTGVDEARVFNSIISLTNDVFHRYEGLVYIVPCGVVVRAIAPLLEHKTQDPAVVVVDVCGRWAISLLSGHEGGANDLAISIANILGADPVITTTTEAAKNLIVGVGCRRNTEASSIIHAVRIAVDEIGGTLEKVRLLASADVKSDEVGLKEAANFLGIALRYVPSDEIRATALEFEHSDFVMEKVDLPAVAEPCALLAGRRTRLILKKKKYDGVTVAIAQENCLW